MSVKVCELNGIESMEQFYLTIAQSLELPSYFAPNLDALYDSLCTDVEGPVFIHWLNHQQDRLRLGETYFQNICAIFNALQEERSDFFVYFN